mmetsp:Transcript_10257/g.38089  ORF Transcript_10257/g.38089 Transcript_10257/m.38089 type:complete len:446 (-) Transcript_10257:71-1408(-)
MPLRGHTFSYHIQCITAHISVLTAQTPEAHQSELHKNQHEVVSYIHALQSCLLLAQRLQKDIEERIKIEEKKITIDMLDQSSSGGSGSNTDGNDVVFIPYVAESKMDNQHAESSLIIASDVDSNASSSTIESILSNSSRNSNGGAAASSGSRLNASPTPSSTTSNAGSTSGPGQMHHSSTSSTSTHGSNVDAPPSPRSMIPPVIHAGDSAMSAQQTANARLYRAMSGSALGRRQQPYMGNPAANVNQPPPVSSVAEEIFLPHGDSSSQNNIQQQQQSLHHQLQQQQIHQLQQQQMQQQQQQLNHHRQLPSQTQESSGGTNSSSTTLSTQIDLDELLQQPLKPVHAISVKVEETPSQDSGNSSLVDRTPTNRGLLVLDELLNDNSSSSPQSAVERPKEMLSFSSPEQQEKEKILNLFSSFESKTSSGSNQSHQSGHSSFSGSFPNL